MRTFPMPSLLLALSFLIGLGCSLSLYATPLSPPTASPFMTLTPSPIPPTATQSSPPSPLPASPMPLPSDFCADERVAALIRNLGTALQTANGTLLASLISPVRGLDVRYYRDGRVVNYDRAHAEFVFTSTYSVDWGLHPGSGLPTTGSFHDVVLPALLEVFDKDHALYCNEIKVGGATYTPRWPYSEMNYYSAHFAGTESYGHLDWRTWLIGAHYIERQPYLYALLQFQWEP